MYATKCNATHIVTVTVSLYLNSRMEKTIILASGSNISHGKLPFFFLCKWSIDDSKKKTFKASLIHTICNGTRRVHLQTEDILQGYTGNT